MSIELNALRKLWQTTPGPNDHTWASARAILYQEIDGSQVDVVPRVRLARWHDARRRQRLVVLLAAVTALLLAIGVASTFGVGLPSLDFWRAEKAPPGARVVKNFAALDQGAPPGMATGVIPDETRKVARFGDATLWVAPTRQGGFCTDLAGEGGCDRLGTVPLSVNWDTVEANSGPPSAGTSEGPPVVNRVSGYVNARWADGLEIHFEDGEVLTPEVVWVSKPIQAGFFSQSIPALHREPGHLVAAVVALDGSGRLVTSDSLDHSRRTSVLQDALFDHAAQLAVIDTSGGPVSLRTAPTRYEGRCAWVEFQRRRIPVSPCLPRGYERGAGLGLAVHSFGGSLILAGVCGYSAVQLVHSDGYTRTAGCTDGLVFTELDSADAAGSVRAVGPDMLPLPGSTVPVPRLLSSR
jgi:hypothetical protein